MPAQSWFYVKLFYFGKWYHIKFSLYGIISLQISNFIEKIEQILVVVEFKELYCPVTVYFQNSDYNIFLLKHCFKFYCYINVQIKQYEVVSKNQHRSNILKFK